jgi:hypothetical protein
MTRPKGSWVIFLTCPAGLTNRPLGRTEIPSILTDAGIALPGTWRIVLSCACKRKPLMASRKDNNALRFILQALRNYTSKIDIVRRPLFQGPSIVSHHETNKDFKDIN